MDEEPDIIQQVLNGERSAFTPLIDRYRSQALRIARRMLRDHFDAEDVMQEASLQAFLGLSSLRTQSRFGPWLFGIVINLCKMRLRARRDWHPAEEWHGGRVPKRFTVADLQPSPESIYEARELHQLVLRVVSTLPDDQQQAVRMYYVNDLTLSEIASLLDVTVGTVKVRLHRARERMRVQLEEQLDRSPEPAPNVAKEVSTMIEVTVHDVMVRAPKDDPSAEWLPAPGKKYKLGFTRVMLLKERTGERILPIWVGPTEGDAIAMLLADVSTPRPMTLELITRILDVAKMSVEKVAVTKLSEDTYYATIWVKVKGTMREIDARPSDAVALALRTKAPIFVATEVLQGNQNILSSNDVIETLEEVQRRFMEERNLPAIEETEMEWRSFRAVPRGDIA